MQKALSTAALLVVIGGLLLITQGPSAGEAWRFYVGLVLFLGFALLVVVPPIWLHRRAHGDRGTALATWRFVEREAPFELALVAVLVTGSLLAVLPLGTLTSAIGLAVFAMAAIAAVGAAVYMNVFGYFMRDPEAREERRRERERPH